MRTAPTVVFARLSPALLVLAAGAAAAHGQFVFSPVCNTNWYSECNSGTPCGGGGFMTVNNWGQGACAGGLPTPGPASTASVGATTITLNNAATVATLNTVAGTVFDWVTGDLTVVNALATPGTWHVRSGHKTLGASVTNTGTWNLRDSWQLTLPGGMTFTNNGTLNLLDKDMTKGGGGAAAIQNNGTMDQVGGTNDVWNGGLAISNNGVLRSTAGTWLIDNSTLTSTPAASWVTAAGGQIHLRTDSLSGTFNGAQAGTFVVSSGTTIAGPTTLNLTGNGVSWTDGDITVSPGASLANAGTITVRSGHKTLHGSLASSGTINLADSWQLTLDNSTLTNSGTITLTDKDMTVAAGATGVINNHGLISQTGGTNDVWNGGLVINNQPGATLRSTAGTWLIDNNTLTSAASAQWVTGAGGTMWLRGDALSGVYNFANAGAVNLGSGTTIAGSTVFTVSGNPVRWHDGDMNIAGGSSFTLSAGGGMTVGSGNKTVRGEFNNNGTLHLVESWQLVLENAALTNHGVMNVSDKDMTKSPAGTGVIVNHGTMDQTGGTGDTWNGGLSLTNHGTVRSTAGAWHIDGNTLASMPGAQWNTGPGGTFWVRGDTLHGSFTIANAGSFNFGSGTTFDADSLLATSGNPVRWNDGDFTVSTGATLTLASGGALNIGSSHKALHGAMVNNGTIRLIESWNLALGNGDLTNNSVIELADKDMSSVPGGTGRLVNHGTIVQTGGTNDGWGGDLPIVNHGLMHSQAGGWLMEGAALTNSASGVLRSDAYMRLAPGFTLGAGRMQGTGTFNVNGTIFNSGGSVAPGNSVGTLTLEGSYTQSGTGKLAVEIAGPSAADKLQLTSGFPHGIATLGGVVEITRAGGYVPTAGARWTILTSRVRNGQFAGVTSANPSAGISYRLLYNANNSVDVLVLGSCGQADVGSQGGIPGPDGLLNNNDFVVYINGFFNQDPISDVGIQGGTGGSDGLFNNNDFVVFINSFFGGCAI